MEGRADDIRLGAVMRKTHKDEQGGMRNAFCGGNDKTAHIGFDSCYGGVSYE